MYVASKSLMSTFVVTLTLITQSLFTVIIDFDVVVQKDTA
jgi:hypothetical protein